MRFGGSLSDLSLRHKPNNPPGIAFPVVRKHNAYTYDKLTSRYVLALLACMRLKRIPQTTGLEILTENTFNVSSFPTDNVYRQDLLLTMLVFSCWDERKDLF